MRSSRRPRPLHGFSLIELLVVVSIIALLAGVLLPALGQVRQTARSGVSLSNMRQIGIALTGYATEYKGLLPIHSSTIPDPKPRWPDYIYPFISSTKVFRSPNLTPDEVVRMSKPFYHTTVAGGAPPGVEQYHGGYGYNFQYLGNARFTPAFHARLDTDVTRPVSTVGVGDTAGSRKGSLANPPGVGGEAVYALDPPLPSARTAHPDGRPYYATGSVVEPAGDSDTYLWRSYPAQRNRDKAGFTFLDGHGALQTMALIDDMDRDGVKDNGYWNGKADPASP